MQKTWPLALLAGAALLINASGDAEARGKRRSHRSTHGYSQRGYRFVPVYRVRSGYLDWRDRPARVHDGLDRRYRMPRRSLNRGYSGRYREHWVADRDGRDCPPYFTARERRLTHRRLQRANRGGYSQRYGRYY